MALLLAAARLAACSSPRHALPPSVRGAAGWAALLGRIIPDAERPRRLKALGEGLGSLREAFDRDLADLGVQVEALDTDYDATPEQVDRVITRFAARCLEVLAQYREVVLAARLEASAAEWRLLTD